MAGSRVAADWAWISKDLAAGIGYSVLQASTSELDFGALMGRYVPGSPSSAETEPASEAPPWITLGPVGVSRDDVLMSVSVRDPFKERDHTGRPVWPQRLLVARYTDLATAQASYQTIWEAVRAAPVPAPDAAPLALTIAPQPPADLLPVFDEYGFDTLAVLAAALLERPVAIADGTHRSREQRLAVFDAVAALLPYGLRADLSVSSSVNNTTQHGIRLVFAAFANDGQQLISLVDKAPVPAGTVSQRYLAMLREREKTCGLQAVIEHLWRFRQPCSFDQSTEVLAILAQLDYVNGVIRELGQGPISLPEIADFLIHDPVRLIWKDLDERVRRNALSSLLVDGPQVAAVLVRCWKFLRGDVIQRINSQLDAGDPRLATWCLGVLQHARSGDDRLLGDLLVPNERIAEGARWNQRFTMLVELLRQRPVPGPSDYQYALDQLRFGDASDWQARLVREVLTRELADAARADRARSWVDWLCRSPFAADWPRPDWVSAMDFLVLPPTGQAEYGMRAIISRDVAWTVLLLRLAAHEGRLGDLVTLASLALVELASATARQIDESQRLDLAAELRADLRKLGVGAEAAAHVDAALVLSGGEPRYFPLRLQDQQWGGRYLAGLNAAFALDAVQRQVHGLEQRFLEFALSYDEAGRLGESGVWLLKAWSADPGRQRGLLEFLAGLAPGTRPRDERLPMEYWFTARAHPALAAYAATGDLLTAAGWTVERQDVSFLLLDFEDGVRSTRLARACYEARRAGLSPEEIMRALAATGGASIPAKHLDNMLREFQGLLNHLTPPTPPGAEWQAADDVLIACQQLITDDMVLGFDAAEQFDLYLDRRLEAEIKIGQDRRKEIARRRSRARVSARKGMVGRLFTGAQPKAPGQQDGGAARSDLPREPPTVAGRGLPAEGATGEQREGNHAHRP